MTKQSWVEREAAWERFRQWERTLSDHSTPQERLARVGEFVELYLRRHGSKVTKESLAESIEAIRSVRDALRFVRCSQ